MCTTTCPTPADHMSYHYPCHSPSLPPLLIAALIHYPRSHPCHTRAPPLPAIISHRNSALRLSFLAPRPLACYRPKAYNWLRPFTAPIQPNENAGQRPHPTMMLHPRFEPRSTPLDLPNQRRGRRFPGKTFYSNSSRLAPFLANHTRARLFLFHSRPSLLDYHGRVHAQVR